jgi:hypothetical protein
LASLRPLCMPTSRLWLASLRPRHLCWPPTSVDAACSSVPQWTFFDDFLLKKF